jgi:hypothetical protein
MLLAMQLASVFKHVDDLGKHRESYNKFTSLEGEHGDIINLHYEETNRKGRAYVDAIVNSERNGFRFRQHYNFGILLELEITYLDESGNYSSLLDVVKNQTIESTHISELMIEFEYCISIFTEHVASNLINR